MSSEDAASPPQQDHEVIGRLVDLQRYPLTQPGSEPWWRAVNGSRAELATDGCSVLRDFVRPDLQQQLRDEGMAIADRAWYDEVTVNVYNTAPDAGWPADHPARIAMRRGNAFVARDRIPHDWLIHRLYLSELFQQFLAACLTAPRVHPLADPLAGLCLNVIEPDRAHPWHFDTNEFSVSLLTCAAEDGGVFEYCPNIRRAGAENLGEVRAVLDGRADARVHRLVLRPGDLQLFRGRFSLHRVSPVRGRLARHTAILSYSESEGVVGRAERTRQLFGRLTQAHDRSADERVDELLD